MKKILFILILFALKLYSKGVQPDESFLFSNLSITIPHQDNYINNFKYKLEDNLNNDSIKSLEIKEVPVSQNHFSQDNNHFALINNISSVNQKKIEKVEKTDENLRISESDYIYNDYKKFTLTGKTPFKENNVETKDILIYGGGLGVLFLAQHYVQMKENWKDKQDFRFKEDAIYSLYVDKGTHFLNTYFPCYLFSEGLIAMGYNKDNSVLYGSLMGLAYQTYIEIMDGFGQNYGFSPSDYYADIAGAAFYYLQHKYGIAEWITPKFAYIPADWHGELRRLPHTNFVDDYSSQTVYFSINVHHFMPDSWKRYYPEWLELTVGYAARNLCDSYTASLLGKTCDPVKSPYQTPEVNGSPRLIIGLDYNLTKLLPEGAAGWNWFKQTLNLLKLPSPAIEIGERTRFLLLYPFPIN